MVLLSWCCAVTCCGPSLLLSSFSSAAHHGLLDLRSRILPRHQVVQRQQLSHASGITQQRRTVSLAAGALLAAVSVSACI